MSSGMVSCWGANDYGQTTGANRLYLPTVMK